MLPASRYFFFLILPNPALIFKVPCISPALK